MEYNLLQNHASQASCSFRIVGWEYLKPDVTLDNIANGNTYSQNDHQ